MGKRLLTTGKTAWRRIRHLFRAVTNPGRARKIAAQLSGPSDSPPSADQRRNHGEPPPFPRKKATLPSENPHRAITCGHRTQAGTEPPCLLCYLRIRQNCPDDIEKLNQILQMPQVLLEIGCGNANAARRIALKNPGIGVVATDLYAEPDRASNGSGYGKIARAWGKRCLPAQTDPPANLVVLRAEACLLRCLPARAVDTVFLINPEPRVGKSFLALVRKESLLSRLKQGRMQVVILPFSRELGVGACGGFSFEHGPDWSKGLGFIMESGFGFREKAPVQWGVDLSLVSAYTRNSTQSKIYICGQPPG